MNEVPLIWIEETEPNRFKLRSIAGEFFYQSWAPSKDESTKIHVSIELTSSLCLGIIYNYFKNIPGTQVTGFDSLDPNLEDPLNRLKKGH